MISFNSLFSYNLQFPGFAINTKNEVMWWNQECSKLTGVSEQEILGKNTYWKIFFYDKKSLPIDFLLNNTLPSPESIGSLNFTQNTCFGFYKIEKEIDKKSLLWISASRLFDDKSNCIGASLFFQVISLRHLYWNSPLLSELITQFPFPTAIIVNGKIAIANTLYANLLGYNSPQKIYNKPIKTFIHSTEYEKYSKTIEQNYDTTQSEYHWKYCINNTIKYIVERPRAFKKGNDIAIISSIFDETEQKQKEKEQAIEKEKLIANNNNLLKQLLHKQGFFISNSTLMQNLLDKAIRLAKSEINLVLLGETGTGKTLLAKTIHDIGPRKNSPFITVNCAAIPENLLESAFFGHVKGAFTGAHSASKGFLESAHKGTLFLDEVAELSPALQAKLLHAIENKYFTPLGSSIQKECDIRIISATHRNLNTLLQEGKLREDFFYRIFIVDLHLPALRERKEDIPLLINFFLEKYSTTNTIKKIPDTIYEQMLNAPWYGNIRELQNAVLRFIATDEFNKTHSEQADPLISTEQYTSLLDIEKCKAEAEKKCLLNALHISKGNKTHASQLLNINLRTFHRYCKKYSL